MLVIPSNFTQYPLSKKLIICLKIITYFDTYDIDELRPIQIGGGSNTAGNTTTTVTASSTKNSDDFKIEAVDTSEFTEAGVNPNENGFIAGIKTLIVTIRKVSALIVDKIGYLVTVFIMAATLPAFPFFIVMGFMYSTVKYFMFKFRTL